MKRIILVVILSLVFVGCLDKLQAAKTTVAVLQIGLQSLDSIVVKIAQDKKTECLKLGNESSEAFKQCYKKTADMVEAVSKLRPQLEEALSLASAAIKAKEQKDSGQSVDYITPIKKGVCLLTKLSTWLPEKYRKKIETFLALASNYACSDPVSIQTTRNHQRYVLKQMKTVLSELLGHTV